MSSVRSVSVRLDAKVTKYIADMKAAGKATDQAFSGAIRTSLALDANQRRLTGGTQNLASAQQSLARDIDVVGGSARRTESSINQLSGRLTVLGKLAAALGPGLLPIGAIGVPAVSGLVSQLGFAAVGMGTLVAATQGVGDALTAVNDAALDPTAANLEKAREAMDRLGPQAQTFVTQFQELRPVLGDIRDAAARGWFPGLTESLTELEAIAPEVADLFERVGETGGRLVAEGASALAGPEWADFRSFLTTDAPPALDELGRTIGNLTLGMAELWMAFDPVNDDFSRWLLDASRSFADWADSLAYTQGFEDFVGYLRQTGPQVADLAASVGDAFLQIAQAAAPLGGPVLAALTAVADAIAAIADSPLGTPLLALASGMSAASLATRALEFALGGLSTSSAATAGKLGALARTAGLLFAGLATVDSVQSSFDGLNMTTNELGNALARMELGGSLPTDLADLGDQIERLANPNLGQSLQDSISGMLGGIGNDELHDRSVATIQALDSALAGIASSDSADAARDALHQVADAAGLSDSEFRELAGMLPGYRDAMALAASSTSQAGAASRQSAAEVQELTDALLRNSEAALGAFDAETRYRQALVTAREQARSNTAGINGNSDAALENRVALGQLAAAWNNQSEAVRNNDRRFRDARATFIETARAMGVPEKAARELARQILAIPESRRTRIVLEGAEGARSAIQGLKGELAGIPRNVTTTYSVRRVGQIPKGSIGATPENPDPLRDPLKRATGGTVPGQRQPYGDKILAYLAPGEEVISNSDGQADRHRALLKAINANRLPTDFALAAGGTRGHYLDRTRKRPAA